MVKTIRLIFSVLFALQSLGAATTAIAPGSYELAAGDTAVGFTIIESSRSTIEWEPGTFEKPLRGWFWYPVSHPNTANSFTYRHYIDLLNEEKRPEENLTSFHRILNGFGSDTLLITDVEAYLDQEARISQMNGKLSSRSPLVLLSGAHPIYFVELAEQLSKMGYAVLSVPRTGMRKGTRLSYTAEGVEEYQADTEALIDHLALEGLIDLSQIAFISWSFEGIATLHLAKTKQVKCFLSLDSAIGYDYGIPLVDETMIDNLPFAVIHYSGLAMDRGKQLTLLNTYPEQVTIISDFNLNHGAFTSIRSMTIHQMQYGRANPVYMDLIHDIQVRLKSAFEK